MNAQQAIFLVSAVASLIFVLTTWFMASRSTVFNGEQWIAPGAFTIFYIVIYSAWATEVFA